ncbi:acyltransferase family protein [Streptomyces sp. NPDC002490]|uniref:acyltransferase family protein n=1 Tax=Streptomyces sp. NPDC002490 TaxID=3154416 RepID=UPI003320E0B3
MTNSLRPTGRHPAPSPPPTSPDPPPGTDPAEARDPDDLADGVPTPRSRRAEHLLTTPVPPDPGARPATQRDPFFDNAKYLAIVLVAMGHAWEPLTDQSRTATALYLFVYAFHMPAFILISGYFSRSFDMSPARVRKLLTTVVAPYVVFEIAYTFFKRWADDDPGHRLSLLDPWYLTWFLIALFVWRISTPLWKVVRWPVPVALGIAALASASPSIGDDFDLQRVLQFLPFFVIGLYARPEHFQLLRRREVRLLSVPVIVLALATSWWAVPRMDTGWLYHSNSAQELGAPWWTGPVMTFALFGCSLLLTACFLSWVPRRRTWFTVLGAGTLCGYLLHGFLAKGSRFWGWYDPAWLHEPHGQVFVTLVAGAAITLMCTPPVRHALRFALEPRLRWAMRSDAVEVARGRARDSG